MKKNILICLGILLCTLISCHSKHSSTVSTPPEINTDTIAMPRDETTLEQFITALDSNKYTLVDFYATWCNPCKQMHPVLEQLQEEISDSITIVKIDIDKNEEIAQYYLIESIPTLILFNNSEELWRRSGYMPLQQLKTLLPDTSNP